MRNKGILGLNYLLNKQKPHAAIYVNRVIENKCKFIKTEISRLPLKIKINILIEADYSYEIKYLNTASFQKMVNIE